MVLTEVLRLRRLPLVVDRPVERLPMPAAVDVDRLARAPLVVFRPVERLPMLPAVDVDRLAMVPLVVSRLVDSEAVAVESWLTLTASVGAPPAATLVTLRSLPLP